MNDQSSVTMWSSIPALRRSMCQLPRAPPAFSADASLAVLCRAAEHARGDSITPLLVDNPACVLADVVRGSSSSAPPARIVDLVAVRTRAIDAWLEQPTWPPVRTTKRQIVVLGAASDTRAFRMGLGQQATIFEVAADSSLLDWKRSVLAESFRQRTAVVSVQADLCDAEATGNALMAAGLDSKVPTKWVLEGPLTMLAGAPAAGSLFAMAAQCSSAPGSAIAASLLEPAYAAYAAALGGDAHSESGRPAPCLAPVEVTLEHVRRAGWREKRIVREADVVTTYARELPASVALVFAESDPDP